MKKRSVLTFTLLGLAILFMGLAIFLAISINNRNVNPDNTSADEIDCTNLRDTDYGQCMNSNKCDQKTTQADKESCTQSCVDQAKKTEAECIANKNSATPVDCSKITSSGSCTGACGWYQCDPSGGVPSKCADRGSSNADVCGPSGTKCDSISYSQCPSSCQAISCDGGDKYCAALGTKSSQVCNQKCGTGYCGGGQYCSQNNGKSVCCDNNDPNCNTPLATVTGLSSSGGSSSSGGESTDGAALVPTCSTNPAISISRTTLSPGQYVEVKAKVNNANSIEGSLYVFNSLNIQCAGVPCAAQIPIQDADRDSSGKPVSSALVAGTSGGVRFISPGANGEFTWYIGYSHLFGTEANPKIDTKTSQPLTNVQFNVLAGGMQSFSGSCVTYITKEGVQATVISSSTAPITTTTSVSSSVTTTAIQTSATTSNTTISSTVTTSLSGGGASLPNTDGSDGQFSNVVFGVVLILFSAISGFYIYKRRTIEEKILN